jgi:transcriptional regulator with XRE-family HTH domain
LSDILQVPSNSTGNGSGISQEAFAHKAGIHRTYASSIERGRVQVSIAIASQLADALEISLSKLFRDVERFANGELSEDSVDK